MWLRWETSARVRKATHMLSVGGHSQGKLLLRVYHCPLSPAPRKCHFVMRFHPLVTSLSSMVWKQNDGPLSRWDHLPLVESSAFDFLLMLLDGRIVRFCECSVVLHENHWLRGRSPVALSVGGSPMKGLTLWGWHSCSTCWKLLEEVFLPWLSALWRLACCQENSNFIPWAPSQPASTWGWGLQAPSPLGRNCPSSHLERGWQQSARELYFTHTRCRVVIFGFLCFCFL